MIDLSPPFYPVTLRTGEERRETVLVFRDHAEPTLFHALPPSPRLVLRDDAPAFRLLKYRFPAEAALEGQQMGGGMALFEVEAGLRSAELETLRREVARAADVPDARVLPVVFRRGTARSIIAQSGDNDRLFEDHTAERPVSVAPPHVAAFALDLSQSGATLVDKAARDGGVPVGVLYDFAFEGLLPAIEARVRMDYDRCYERFAAALSGEFYYVRAELGTDLKWLREHDAIDIDIDSLVDEAGRAERERRVMALVQARVEQDFFKSAMPTKPTGAAGPLSGLLSGLLGPEEPEASSAMFVLKARFELEVELKTFEMDLHERIAQTFSHVSAGQLAWMFEGREPNVVEMELGEDFFRRLELRVVRAFDPAQLPGFVRCVVDVEHPRASRSFVLGAEETLEHRLSVPLAPGEARTYRWRVRFEFEEGVGHGPATLEGGPFESDRLVLAVGSESAVDWSRVRLVTTPWLDEVDSYLAQVRVFEPGDGGAVLAEESVLLDRAHDRHEVVVRRPAGGAETRAEVRVTTVLRDGRRSEGVPEALEQADGTVIVTPSVGHRVQLRFVCAADWERTAQVLITARYPEGDGERERDMLFTAAGERTVSWAFLDAEATRGWRYRQVLVRTDGTVDELDWVETEESTVVVGRVGAPEPELRVVLVGELGAALGVTVRVWSLGHEAEARTLFFHAAGAREERVRLSPVDGGLSYGFDIRRVTAEGEVPVRAGEDESQVLVVMAGQGPAPG